MQASRDRLLAFAMLALALLVNTAGLWPEIAISRVDLNDNVFHFTLIERIVRGFEAGENPLDCWSPEWSLGFPVLRTYQPLAHLLVAGTYFALGKSVSLMTVFVWLRFLSVALLPLTFFITARALRLTFWAAAAAALLAPLISTDFLYGIEYGSFTWAGSGLFPQAVATHLLLLSLGAGFIAIREGRRWVIAGILVGLTVVCHLIYGYMAAASLLLLAMIPDRSASRLIRFGRTLAVGAVAFAIAAFQLIPLLRDASLLNHSRWEPVWKWDSFGAGAALSRLVTGELLDHARLPVLTALAVGGALLWFWKRRQGSESPAHLFLVAGAVFWILLYFGRPFWGPLLTVLGVAGDMHLHRVIGGAQIFLLLLAALALAEAWETLSRRWHYTAAIALSAVLLYPMVRERAANLANDAAWGRRNLETYTAERQAVDAVIATAKTRGGRTYAGLAATWGGRFKVGDVPLYAFLSEAQVPAVAFLYHSMALTGDLMVRFNDAAPAQYRLFNIRTVVAPANSLAAPPGLLAPRAQFGRFQVFDAPGGGYFELVDALAAVTTTRRNFYDVNDRWLQSDWPAKRAHLLLDWRGTAPSELGRIEPDAALPILASAAPNPGDVVGEQQSGETYRAECEVLRPSYALFKMTWHPNWKAYVDGTAQPVVMLSPGFAAVAVPPGRHRVEFRYEPGPIKPALAIAGLLAVGLIGSRGRRFAPALPRIALPKPAVAAAMLVALSLPVAINLFTGSLLWGHDAFCYFPRVTETHQNLVNGILLPRWAPDLGRGYGQPLFLFHPPLFYWIAELCHLLGFDAVTAVNLACALLVLAAAVAMFLFGRLYFGDTGGLLAAAAYLYAPYFAVDLYVRSALEEFAAFPLFPLALYGFGAFAREGKRRYWVLGAASYAALLFCHFPAALLFTPLLLGFLALTGWMARSWRVLAAQAAGFALGLGLSACSWLPALAEKQYVAIHRVLEGNGQYAAHFVYLHQLFSSKWGYGYSLRGPDDGMSFALGWSHVALAVAAWIWIVRRPKLAGRALMRFFAAAGVLLCILMLEDAIWLWDHLPLLPYVELPWRMLGPAAVCVAMLIAALAPVIASLPRFRGLALGAAFALLIVPNLPHLQAGRTAEVDPAFWTPRELAVRGFETTTMGEMTPRWMLAVPPYNPAAAALASGDAQIREERRTPFSWSGEVQAKTATRVRMSIAYYPGWGVRIDGRPAEAVPEPGGGLIEFAVPPGNHQVDVGWGRSSERRLGEAISLAALLILAAAMRWPFTGRFAAARADAGCSLQSS